MIDLFLQIQILIDKFIPSTCTNGIVCVGTVGCSTSLTYNDWIIGA